MEKRLGSCAGQGPDTERHRCWEAAETMQPEPRGQKEVLGVVRTGSSTKTGG